jgi:hypothetical protein
MTTEILGKYMENWNILRLGFGVPGYPFFQTNNHIFVSPTWLWIIATFFWGMNTHLFLKKNYQRIFMLGGRGLTHPHIPYAPWCWYIYLQNWVIYVGQMLVYIAAAAYGAP